MTTQLRPTGRPSRGSMPYMVLALVSSIILLTGMVLPPSAAADMPEATATAGSTAVATGASITIFSWECVSGTLTGQPMSYYQGEDQCEGVKLDVVFDVTDDTGTQQTQSAKNGSQVEGLVGEVTLEETLPDGYESPAIFCTPLNGQSGQEINGSGNAVTLPANLDDAYQCSFYNIPTGVSATGTGDVWVDTYVCASMPQPDSTYAWYHQNCTTRQNGATFVLNAPGGDTELTTGDVLDGAATMRGLEPGEYALDEKVAIPDYEIGAVFCAEIGKADIPGPAQMMQQEMDGTAIPAPVTADMLLYCQWFHVPTGTSATPVSGSFRQAGVALREAGALLLAA